MVKNDMRYLDMQPIREHTDQEGVTGVKTADVMNDNEIMQHVNFIEKQQPQQEASKPQGKL